MHELRSPRIPMVFIATIVLAIGSPGFSRANPTPELPPPRIQTADELREHLQSAEWGTRVQAGNQLRILWDGRRSVLETIARATPADLHDEALEGLAKNGAPEAVRFLVGVVADTLQRFEDRMDAARWLGEVADSSALPALRAFAPAAHRRSCFHGGSVDLAIRRIERPDLRRPLIERGGPWLKYRFLLDDIRAIYVLRDPAVGVYHGQVVDCNSGGARYRHDFGRSQFRRICDLLQQGKFYEPSEWGEGRELVFELEDGRHVALTGYGSTFHLEGNLLSPGFHLRADSLVAYLEQSIGKWAR